jgi:hypothetical protein
MRLITGYNGYRQILICCRNKIKHSPYKEQRKQCSECNHCKIRESIRIIYVTQVLFNKGVKVTVPELTWQRHGLSR